MLEMHVGIWNLCGMFTTTLKQSGGHLPPLKSEKPFYYTIKNLRHGCSKGTDWTWYEVRLDAVIGTKPRVTDFSDVDFIDSPLL